MILVKYRLYDFYTLQYVDGEFVLVQITRDWFSSIELAKTKILSSFAFDPKDVPVIVDPKGRVHYYHSRHDVWYKGLSDAKVAKFFNFLVPSTD